MKTRIRKQVKLKEEIMSALEIQGGSITDILHIAVSEEFTPSSTGLIIVAQRNMYDFSREIRTNKKVTQAFSDDWSAEKWKYFEELCIKTLK